MAAVFSPALNGFAKPKPLPGRIFPLRITSAVWALCVKLT
jgi:hypothetical protein